MQREMSYQHLQATKAGIVNPLSNRVYLFDPFEKPPTSEQEFIDYWIGTLNIVQKQEHFISVHLHQCIGPDSKFQWITFAIFDSNDICVFGKPNAEWDAHMKQRNSDTKFYPGEYHEISSYNGEALTGSAYERPPKSRFLVTLVSADDSVSNDELESNWKSMMKTDFIHGNLKGNTDLKDSLLYRLAKVLRAQDPAVRYAVRTELSFMDDEEGVKLAKLVDEQQNAKGVKTQTGFYKIYTNKFFKKD